MFSLSNSIINTVNRPSFIMNVISYKVEEF